MRKQRIFIWRVKWAGEERVNLGKPGEFLLEGILDCIHEITTALAFADRMSDSAYRVETTPRLAQWRIENLASCTYRKSDPFKIGKWNWYLSIHLFMFIFPCVRKKSDHVSFKENINLRNRTRKQKTHTKWGSGFWSANYATPHLV